VAGSTDELGAAFGGSGYPERPLCKSDGCTRRASKGRGGFCYRCGRTPEGGLKDRDRQGRRGIEKQGRTPVGLSISQQEWIAIWTAQGGLCPIDLHPLRNRYNPAPQPGTRVAALDHDHVLESQLKKQGVNPAMALRSSLCGLLCGYPCNRLLVRHWTVERLENAARFRRARHAPKVVGHA
jgi:hypothetical protein